MTISGYEWILLIPVLSLFASVSVAAVVIVLFEKLASVRTAAGARPGLARVVHAPVARAHEARMHARAA